MSRIPRRLVLPAPLPVPALLSISQMMPAKLSATPPAFFRVIGSLRANAAMNIV